ncbi:methyltransferase domain-containing protein [Kutzneria kofuensis]|uniref:2-polyprenyl-3-methyl-5-hydroxy-6-metoxy-1, 4-benzoquinol methylase n=1 Tax=Kutzneria kofuensis TaxID=103725 RepID=A0A7W9NKK3_9PSEU|nr:methyltransferase domain-containing protein [Kutzneria kofuensis]MBB5895358.1 2-polyprenyl-3-methyl-5-hydroxy-6-metoxy-1,4-benzoquinol methylase [Kutzneria kofuensis]
MEPTDLSARIFQNAVGALELYTMYIGERLGYYRALADGGPLTSSELAQRTGTAERYAREWLEHHAAAGLVEVVEPGRYLVPAGHVPVLADASSLLFGTSMSIELVRAARRLGDVVDAFRTGGAPAPMTWEPEGRWPSNRPVFMNLLGSSWLPAIPSVHKRLSTSARVADIACGLGWSSIAMAQAYPEITVHGLDLDERAIESATRSAEESGVADRVRFSAADAATGLDGPYDLVTIIEALHDMAYPVAVLSAARESLADDGFVLVIDERTDPEPAAPASQREQYLYGWSVISCLPDAMGVPDSAATGTVMRPETLRHYASEAGFRGVEMLPIGADKWAFYLLSD